MSFHATLVIPLLIGILGGGVVFEIGRRIGSAGVERRTTQADVQELDQKIDTKFESLDTKIDDKFEELDEKIDGKFTHVNDELTNLENKTDRAHRIVVDWLTNLTETMRGDGYNVEPPNEVRRDIDLDSDFNNDQGYED